MGYVHIARLLFVFLRSSLILLLHVSSAREERTGTIRPRARDCAFHGL